MKKLLTIIGAAAVAVGTSLDAVAEELVTNDSFESYTGTIGNSGKYDNLSASLTLDGWTRDPNGGNVGLSTASDTTTWKNVANVKGNIACYFQKNASLSQTINVAEAGTYRVSFRYASRLSPQYYGNGRFYIEIDGAEVGYADCGTSTTFQTALMETELAVGEHTLVIRHSNELSTDSDKRSNSVIDGISITPKTDNLLFNSGFEGYIGVIPSAHHVNADASHNADGWVGTFYGLSEASSPFLEGGSGSPFEGSTAVHFNGLTEISQNIEIPEDGVYEISFVYEPRDNYYYAGGRVNVWIDDDKVGYVDCDRTDTQNGTDHWTKFRRYMMRTQIAAGGHLLKLSHTLDNPVNSNTPCSAIDDVSLKAVGGNLIMNGSFDMGTVYANSGEHSSAGNDKNHSNPGWTVTGTAGLAKSGSPWISSEINSGLYSMYTHAANYKGRILQPVSISQSFDVTVAGNYELGFSYASRPASGYVGGQLFARIYKGKGLEGEMVWEKFVTATTTTSFEEFVGNVKIYEPGIYTLEFYAPQEKYKESGENNKGTIIDNVSLRFHHKIKGLIISFF